MKIKSIFMIVVAVSFCVSIISCSKPPTESEVKAAIAECSKENMSMFGIAGQNVQVESVVIKEISDYDDEEKCYPVTAVVTVKYNIMGRDQSIPKPGKYQVRKNKQGKWTASRTNELLDAMGKALGL